MYDERNTPLPGGLTSNGPVSNSTRPVHGPWHANAAIDFRAQAAMLTASASFSPLTPYVF